MTSGRTRKRRLSWLLMLMLTVGVMMGLTMTASADGNVASVTKSGETTATKS